MTINELGSFLIFVQRLFGECTMHPEGAGSNTVKIKDKHGVAIAQYEISYGAPTNTWIRMDKIPENKKKEVEKVLQSGRLDNIVLDNG